MARVRRKASASRRFSALRLNLEIAGIVALAVAVLLGFALWNPHHAGSLGAAAAGELQVLFGGAAWCFPILVALLGGIIFLEISVPQLIATLGLAAAVLFLIVDAAYAAHGGKVGSALERGLVGLVGPFGAKLVLAVAALGVLVGITKVSLKQLIGRALVAAAAVRAFLQKALAREPRKPAPRPPPGPPGPGNLREAFSLPERFGARGAQAKAAEPVVAAASASAVPAAATPPATAAPPPALVVVPPAPRTPPGAVEAGDAEDDEYDDDDDDDEYEDDAEDDEAEDGDDDASAGRPIAGEYEPASVLAGDPARRTYRLPDLSLFDAPQAQIIDESTRTHVLEDTLASFGVGAKVTHIERGPSITRYELRPERGVKISRISSLADDLALALAATSVRIEAPIPGKSAVGIEIPNATVSIVAIREILEALPHRGVVPPLNMALGKDITGRPVFGDLAKMPHLLVAGATGSGKSVCLNGIIASLLVSATPDQVQMLFIDPKRVELTVYNGIPHLVKDVITDPRLAAGALFEMTKEMDQRYERFAKAGVRKIEEYNAKYPDEKLPYVVIVIDELADLMMIAPAKVEQTIMRLAQLARATGIHLVVATQRPSVDVITGLIKANIPSRISFAVSSQVDSRTILDGGGAERLLGRGDMLYLPIDAPKPIRAQGALITGAEVNRLVEFWAAQARPDNLLDVDVVPIGDDDEKNAARTVDPLCYDAAKFIIETNYASTAQLQSQFSIGHPRAVRVMKQLEDFGIVGPHEGTKPRRINTSLGELEMLAPRLGRDEQTELFDLRN
jgi:DNA segregation ATPase FtsK/SpoIIIE-like protein